MTNKLNIACLAVFYAELQVEGQLCPSPPNPGVVQTPDVWVDELKRAAENSRQKTQNPVDNLKRRMNDSEKQSQNWVNNV
jgi:hypothetical protein